MPARSTVTCSATIARAALRAAVFKKSSSFTLYWICRMLFNMSDVVSNFVYCLIFHMHTYIHVHMQGRPSRAALLSHERRFAPLFFFFLNSVLWVLFNVLDVVLHLVCCLILHMYTCIHVYLQGRPSRAALLSHERRFAPLFFKKNSCPLLIVQYFGCCYICLM